MPIAVSQGRQKLYSFCGGETSILLSLVDWTIPTLSDRGVPPHSPANNDHLQTFWEEVRSFLLSSPLLPQPHSHHPALFHPAGFEEGSALGKGGVLMQQAGFTSQTLMLITRKSPSSQDLLDWTGRPSGRHLSPFISWFLLC